MTEKNRWQMTDTDSDIFIHCARSNAPHVGDVFFGGVYPFIDASTV